MLLFIMVNIYIYAENIPSFVQKYFILQNDGHIGITTFQTSPHAIVTFRGYAKIIIQNACGKYR